MNAFKLHTMRPIPKCFIYFKKYLFIFRGEGREKEKERNTNMWLHLVIPLLGPWPATQARALTGNRTDNPVFRRLALSLLCHTSRGPRCFKPGLANFS